MIMATQQKLRICAVASLFMVMMLASHARGAAGAPAATTAADSERPAQTATSAASSPPSPPTARVVVLFQRSCALCHVAGEGGAPRVANSHDWQPRLARGDATLLRHALEGFNNMPPLGYCQACEENDMRALIRFLATGR